ncbi:MAG: hypothetical protein Pars2KO_01680 [Parasphingorhabdus sp.]
MNSFRLRQLVLACETQDSYGQLQQILGLGEPFHDPGVAEFGLHNAVFALGDQFLEIVVPINDNAPARRFIDRSGEGGYMAIFQTDNIAAARARIADQNIRTVWNIDLDDISATHLHPADIGGAIVSIDEARPSESWRWGGKDWQERSVPGRLGGAALGSPNPRELAAQWGGALGLDVPEGGSKQRLQFEDGQLHFLQSNTEKLEYFDIAVPDPVSVISTAESLGFPTDGHVIDFRGVQLWIERLPD